MDYGWICFSNAIKTGEKNLCGQWKQAHLFKTSRAAKLPAVLSTHYSLYVYKYKLNHRKEEEEGQNKLHAWFSKEKCLSMSWHSEVLQHGYSAVHHVANISFVVCAWVWFTCNVKKFLQISYFTKLLRPNSWLLYRQNNHCCESTRNIQTSNIHALSKQPLSDKWVQRCDPYFINKHAGPAHRVRRGTSGSWMQDL